MKRKGVN